MLDNFNYESFLENQREKLELKQFDFLKRVYSSGIEKYYQRLQNYSFEGLNRVLDAGCGFGQWTVSLAMLNQHVEAIDCSKERIHFVKELVDKLSLQNVNVHSGTLEQLPFENACFDGVFCYGVIFLTDWKKSLHEFSRVLKKGGVLYINANGLGWYKHLWNTQHNKVDGYDPSLIVAKAFMNTWNYNNFGTCERGVDIIIEVDELKKELEKNNFAEVKIAGEGELQIEKAMKIVAPFFKGNYGGDLGVYEVLSRKILKVDH